ncbi:hypothetical protein BOTBODRAFT_112325, partial [Botryobasidium botryosum FD-172 SS1]
LPKALPPADQTYVDKLLDHEPGPIAKVGREVVKAQDLKRLRPGKWLNDEIINIYGAMILERSEKWTRGKEKGKQREDDGRKAMGAVVREPLDVHYFNSFFFVKLEDPGYAGARLNKWTKKIDIFKKDILLVPVNLGNAHWTCAAINMRLKRVEYYDSMMSRREKVFQVLREYLDLEHRDKKKAPFNFEGWIDHMPEATPRQENGFDCGVFLCQFMEAISRGEEAEEFAFEQGDMGYLRMRMVWEIGKGTLSDWRA